MSVIHEVRLAPLVTNKTGIPCASFDRVVDVLRRFSPRRPPDQFAPTLVARAGSYWAFLMARGTWNMTLSMQERQRCRLSHWRITDPWNHSCDREILAGGAQALKLLTETEYFDFVSWLTAVGHAQRRERDIRHAERELTQAGWTVQPPKLKTVKKIAKLKTAAGKAKKR